ncbi:Holliday junction ATP-dependent DNA helicase RuvA [bioreactor metagenome]|uniref:Holliday junction ATP-dependent DNA helicase RuvA n=1 Tax=bioreactor metagenome TaxID=1076179 RepID=A0A644UYY9_9ZZZZ|nr:Holliday junction branch migration protein RuvA [Negativicutes bacterium]
MIGFVRGKVAQVFNDYCFVDVQGLGYRIFIAEPTRKKITVGEETLLHTYLHVREDALSLFGFLTQDEYQLFLSLISISGVGPKVAMGILSSISPSEFRFAVASKNITVLTKMPGIGKKTAERLILELKDKIGSMESGNDLESNGIEIIQHSDEVIDEALAALLTLGYSHAEISPVLRKIYQTGQTTEDTVRLALKEVGRR